MARFKHIFDDESMNIVVLHKSNSSVHGSLFLAALAVVAVGMPASPWPWYMLLPLLIYGGIALALPPLRRTVPQLSLGRMDGVPLACAVSLSGVTVAVLVGFHVLGRVDKILCRV